MSTTLLEELNNHHPNTPNYPASLPSASPKQEPRHSAPPVMQQPTSTVQEDVIWDESMMEVDDFADVAIQNPAEITTEALRQEEHAAPADPSQVRPEAVHLRGVDNLSADDVRLYVTTLFPSHEFKIEWIDDTSLSIVYESAEIATSALQTISSTHIEEVAPTTLRPAQSLIEPKSIEGLKVRVALVGDKKEKGARDRSRWYLFNPPPDEYDRRRDQRRRGGRRYDPYPRRQRSRSKSPILNYDDTSRNAGVELFPSKLSNGRSHEERRRSRSRSPQRRKRIEAAHPAFANIVQTISTPDQVNRGASRRMDIDASEDLFPEKVGRLSRAAMDGLVTITTQQSSSFGTERPSLQDRISGGEVNIRAAAKKTVELFPQKLGMVGESTVGRSLADRIQDKHAQGTVELFPELLREGGTGRRRRKKAEDHF